MSSVPYSHVLPGLLLGLLITGGTEAEEATALPGDLQAQLDGTRMPVVLTPARLAQAQVDVAASVTVIDREMIAGLGARDIPELLRLVPGMFVQRANGSDFSVDYHGKNLRDIRRLQVLVDGMSVIQPGLSLVRWSDLALSIDDIERIEVTRGPDAAAYGANAFSGVVNIITTHPQDVTGNLLRVAGGSKDVAHSGGRVQADGGGRLVVHDEHSDYRLSFSTRSDSGYDYYAKGGEYRDDRTMRTFNWSSEFRPDDGDRFTFLAGNENGANEEKADLYDGVMDAYEDKPVTELHNRHLMGRWNHDFSPTHELQLQAYWQDSTIDTRWRSCLSPVLLSPDLRALAALSQDDAFGLLEAAGSGNIGTIMAYIGSLPPAEQPLAMNVVALATTPSASGGVADIASMCGDVDLDIRETRYDFEVQDTLQINDRLRVVGGASLRHDRGSSDVYLDGIRHNDMTRVFGHGEWQLAAPLLLNIGAMVESDKISGTLVSPRGGLNWQFLPDQALRVVGSRAYRTQDFYEQYADTTFTFRNLAPVWPADGATAQRFFLSQHSPGDIDPERITSWELGWFAHSTELRSDVDVRVFHEWLGHLQSEATTPFEFNPDNKSTTQIDGVEWQLKYAPVAGTWVWVSYSYQDNDSEKERIEQRASALHSGSVAAAHRFDHGWEGSVAWYGMRHLNYTRATGWNHFERVDLRMAHTAPLGSANLTVSVNAQCRTDNAPDVIADNIYKDKFYGWLGMALTF